MKKTVRTIHHRRFSNEHKKAFTLIELILVMAIMGVLVLLATPKYIGQTDKAQDMDIQNIVMIIESKVGEIMILNPEQTDGWLLVPKEELETERQNDTLYDRNGLVRPSTTPLPDVLYKEIPRIFMDEEFKTYIDGTFYSNEVGKVYYSPFRNVP